MKLEELKEIEAKATPGKWVVNYPEPWSMAVPVFMTVLGNILGSTTHHAKMREDAALIAAARNMLPRLIAVAEAVKACDRHEADAPKKHRIAYKAVKDAIVALEVP